MISMNRLLSLSFLFVSLTQALGADTKFSVKRGFYEKPFDLTLKASEPDLEIRYTLDGRQPTSLVGTVFTAPIRIGQTTIVRAAAFRGDLAVSDVDTQTYLFLSDVVKQTETPAQWPPGKVNHQVFNYGMDPDVVDSAQWGPQMRAALTALPTLSLTTDLANLVDPVSGIYVNAHKKGKEWERPVSAELIHPKGEKGFHINAGLRIRGGFSRTGDNPKHSFRLFFRKEYGEKELEYPIFDSGVAQFQNIDLATAQNYGWHWGDSRNTFLRDIFSHDSQRDIGQPHTQSRFVHLYLNGLYWGIYIFQDRAEAEFAATHFGGNADDYDVVKVNPGPYVIEATDGTLDSWRSIWELAKINPPSPNLYELLENQKLVDVDNLIDYMILIFFSGNTDAPISGFSFNTVPNNWFGIFNRLGTMGYRFFIHDAEHTLFNPAENRLGPFTAGDQFDRSNPHWLHQRLMFNLAYRLRFADKVQKHFLNGGPLSVERSVARVRARAAQIETAIIAESARWGDARKGPTEAPLTKTDWEKAVHYITSSFLPVRIPILLDQLRQAKLMDGTPAPLFPVADVVSFIVNDRLQHGGTISKSDDIAILARAGEIFYTINGEDPRSEDGTLNPAAIALEGGTLTSQSHLTNAQWEYWDKEGSPGDHWMKSTGEWPKGVAPLGYGDGNEATLLEFGPDPMNKRPAAYFRSPFQFEGESPVVEVIASGMVDDGAVFYLNGVEAGRFNMPSGAVTPQTFAATTVEAQPLRVYLDRTLLKKGTNLIAAEVHQSVSNSSDLVLSMDLLVPSYQVVPFQLLKSATVKARARLGNEWSALLKADFKVR